MKFLPGIKRAAGYATAFMIVSIYLVLCSGNNPETETPPPVGGYNVYMGHIHNHTNISGAKGTPYEAYAYARDIAGMDFLGITDHAEDISSMEWQAMGDAAEYCSEDGRFIALRGFEWSSSSNYGHVAVIETADFVRSDSPGTDTFSELCAWLTGTDGIAFFNHPGREDSSGTEFNHFNTAPVNNFAGMELWNKDSGFAEYFYNDGYAAGDGGMGYYDEALQRGWRTGASGSGDDHYATWGTAQNSRMAVLANAKTRDEILAAIRARRFYSTLDRNLSMSFKINGAEMGSTAAAGTCTVEILLDDGSRDDTFTVVELLRNGIAARSWSPGERQVSITEGITVSAGEYYYIAARQADGDEAVSSPVWIE